jgi:putative IMPACT (imprinted ancient) family translation regulator
LALEDLPTVEKVPKVEVLVEIDYSAVTPVQRELPEYGAIIVDEVYGSDVSYRIQLPEDMLEPFLAAVANLTNGQARTEVVARSGT